MRASCAASRYSDCESRLPARTCKTATPVPPTLEERRPVRLSGASPGDPPTSASSSAAPAGLDVTQQATDVSRVGQRRVVLGLPRGEGTAQVEAFSVCPARATASKESTGGRPAGPSFEPDSGRCSGRCQGSACCAFRSSCSRSASHANRPLRTGAGTGQHRR